MSLLLNWKLKKIADKALPSRDFMHGLEVELKQRIGHPIWWVRWGRVAAISCSTLTLLGSGTATYAYTSDEVLPEHPLYPLRQEIEMVESNIALSDDAKAAVTIKHLNRRLHEAQILQKKNRPMKEARLEQIEQKIQTVREKIERASPQKQEALKNSLQNLEQKQEKFLDDSRAAATTDEERKTYDELLQQRHESLKARLKTIHDRREKRRTERQEKNQLQ